MYKRQALVNKFDVNILRPPAAVRTEDLPVTYSRFKHARAICIVWIIRVLNLNTSRWFIQEVRRQYITTAEVRTEYLSVTYSRFKHGRAICIVGISRVLTFILHVVLFKKFDGNILRRQQSEKRIYP